MKARVFTPALILGSGLLLLGGCRQQNGSLQITDLTVGERLYFEQVVAVERAKSVALVHRDLGESLLDSLAAAWGDSVQPELLDGLTGDPNRAVAVGELLLRVVTAEQDSLLRDPGVSRLRLPLPDLNRPEGLSVPAAEANAAPDDSGT